MAWGKLTSKPFMDGNKVSIGICVLATGNSKKSFCLCATTAAIFNEVDKESTPKIITASAYIPINILTGESVSLYETTKASKAGRMINAIWFRINNMPAKAIKAINTLRVVYFFCNRKYTQ